MENNSNEVVEIDLKDLMFAVLHKWRPVLAVAVIMAVLLGGAKGTMTYRKQNDPETAKEARVTYQNDLELYEKNKSTYEREMENLRTDIANQQEYLDHSVRCMRGESGSVCFHGISDHAGNGVSES